jgi:hypothetical protein
MDYGPPAPGHFVTTHCRECNLLTAIESHGKTHRIKVKCLNFLNKFTYFKKRSNDEKAISLWCLKSLVFRSQQEQT